MVLLTNYAIPVEGIRHMEPKVGLFINNIDVDTGSLYITESFVQWMNDSDQGIRLEYKLICLHAISRDTRAFPKEHMLVHYVGQLPGVNSQDEDNDSEDDQSEGELIDIKFVPENSESLQAMFKELADCQTLHPDSDCQLSGDEFDDVEEYSGQDIYQTEADFDQLTEEGQANLERFNEMLSAGQGDDLTARTNLLNISNGEGHTGEGQQDADQFEDADEMDH